MINHPDTIQYASMLGLGFGNMKNQVSYSTHCSTVMAAAQQLSTMSQQSMRSCLLPVVR